MDPASQFRPFDTRTITASIRWSPAVQATLASVTAEITAAVLDDATVVGDAEMIPGLEAMFKDSLDRALMSLADFKDIENSPSPKQRALDLAAKFHQEGPASQGRATFMSLVATELDINSNALDSRIAYEEAVVSFLQTHSKLTPAK
jgi:hypothetical protein